MMEVLLSFKEVFILLIFLVLGDKLSLLLGSLVWAAFGFSYAIPYVGYCINLVFTRILKLDVFVKLLAWSISASGLIGAYLLFRTIFGQPDTIYEWWVIAGVAARAVLRLSRSIIMFEVYDIEDSLRYSLKYFPSSLKSNIQLMDSDVIAGLVRKNFADMNFTPLLQLLASLGLMLFALSNLHVLPTNKGIIPTLVECLAASFSLVGLAPSESVPFTGLIWLSIRLFVGLVLFVWLVAFVSLAISSLPALHEAKVALGIAGEEAHVTDNNVIVQMQELLGAESNGTTNRIISQEELSETPSVQNKSRAKRARRKVQTKNR